MRAYISTDPIGRSIRIGFVSDPPNHPGDQVTAMRPALGDKNDEFRTLSAGEEFPSEYMLRLRSDHAMALLEALVRHFDGGEDTRALRRDYDAERKRVDRFIAHLTREASK